MKNQVLVIEGFNILLKSLAPFVTHELKKNFGPQWWEISVLKAMYITQTRGLPRNGEHQYLVNSLDIQRCIILMDIHWKTVFSKILDNNCRTWIKELLSIRNLTAHIGAEDFSQRDTWRAIDTMVRVCELIDKESSISIDNLLNKNARPIECTDPPLKLKDNTLEFQFKLWANSAEKFGGGLYSVKTIEGYCNELKHSAQELILSHSGDKLIHTNLFFYTTLLGFVDAKAIIEKADNYRIINMTNYNPFGERSSQYPNSLQSAIRLYERFLKETNR